MNKEIYIAAYHQSKFGKLMDMAVPEIVSRAVHEVCGAIMVEPRVLRPSGAYIAMNRAYQMAGVTARDVNFAEIHDCFTVMGALGTEVLGKADYGRGARYWVEGKARRDGECGINTSGGLIAKGHPIGATGVAMVGWCSWQLLGKAPSELQVLNPWVAATFNIGGPICASVCTVLKRP